MSRLSIASPKISILAECKNCKLAYFLKAYEHIPLGYLSQYRTERNVQVIFWSWIKVLADLLDFHKQFLEDRPNLSFVVIISRISESQLLISVWFSRTSWVFDK